MEFMHEYVRSQRSKRIIRTEQGHGKKGEEHFKKYVVVNSAKCSRKPWHEIGQIGVGGSL